jgi:hypothetical protein
MTDDSGHNRDEIEPGVHSFVVKVWREDGAARACRAVWHGHITHVASGRRRHISSIGQLNLFVVHYLDMLHVRLPLFWRIYRRFGR